MCVAPRDGLLAPLDIRHPGLQREQSLIQEAGSGEGSDRVCLLCFLGPCNLTLPNQAGHLSQCDNIQQIMTLTSFEAETKPLM